MPGHIWCLILYTTSSGVVACMRKSFLLGAAPSAVISIKFSPQSSMLRMAFYTNGNSMSPVLSLVGIQANGNSNLVNIPLTMNWSM